jgi:hypothetical protein
MARVDTTPLLARCPLTQHAVKMVEGLFVQRQDVAFQR